MLEKNYFSGNLAIRRCSLLNDVTSKIFYRYYGIL